MKLKGETIFFLGIVGVVAIGLALLFLVPSKPSSVAASDLLVRVDSQFLGPGESKVVLVEFGDFQCSACQAVEPTLMSLRKLYKDKLKFVYRHFPLSIHQNAMAASIASEAAGEQGKFWEYHDLLYQNQDEWSTSMNSRALFESYAKKLNLDLAKFKADRELDSLEQKVRADSQDGRKLGVSGTPTFFLDGKKVTGSYSLESFVNLIDQALKGGE